MKTKIGKKDGDGEEKWVLRKIGEVKIDKMDLDRLMGKEIAEDRLKRVEFVKRVDRIMFTAMPIISTQESVENEIMKMKEELLKTERKEEWRSLLEKAAEKKEYAEFITGVNEVLDVAADDEYEEVKEACINQLIALDIPELMNVAEKMIEGIDHERTRAEMLVKLAKRKIAIGDKEGKNVASKAWNLIRRSDNLFELNEVATAMLMGGWKSVAEEIYSEMNFHSDYSIGFEHSAKDLDRSILVRIFKEQIAVDSEAPIRFIGAHCKETDRNFSAYVKAALKVYAEAGMNAGVQKITKLFKHSDSDDCWWPLGYHYYFARAGMMKEALETVAKYQEEDRESAMRWVLLGLIESGNLKEAKKMFENAIKGTQEETLIIASYIKQLAKAGFVVEAEECYRKYEGLMKGLEAFETLLEIAEAKVGGNIDEALRGLETLRKWANRNNPYSYSSYTNDSGDIREQRIAMVLAKIAKNVALKGDVERAKKLFKEASDLSFSNEGDTRGEVRYAGYIRGEIARMQASVGMFKEALETPSGRAFGFTISVEVKMTIEAVEGYLEFLANKIKNVETQ